MLQFWIRVKDRLDYLGFSQKELAAKIDESYNTLQSWINRDRLPNAEQSVRIANALKTSVEFLVTGKNSRTKPDHSNEIKLLEQVIKNLQDADYS